MNRIFARNLPARSAQLIAGNPISTRLESGVSNCFPGLEFDHRNLDRRFFPGLIFEFVTSDNIRMGVRLVGIVPNDPDFDPATFADNSADRPDEATRQQLAGRLRGADGTTLSRGVWFIDSITQGGKTINLHSGGANGTPFEGSKAWRIVRALERGPVTIHLTRRPVSDGGTVPQPNQMELTGWRRAFTDANTGALSSAFAAGELTQSLCSPWMHDFRDCACFYWASNHPDIVLSEDLPGAPTLPDGASDDPKRANTPIDWLRADRSRNRTVAAAPTETENRAGQMNHYEINERWQDLDFVLQGKESSTIFQARQLETASSFATPAELAVKLRELASLEHAVMLEYLYARYSVLNPASAVAAADPVLRDDLIFVRHEMLLIAVSEMRHLRWVNQLLWELEHSGIIPASSGPSLGVATQVPTATGMRNAQLRPLTSAVLDDFIAVEKPSGTLDGEYAKVLTTLRNAAIYGEHHAQLAGRIVADGTQHYSRFREIRVVLQPRFAESPLRYLVNITPAPPANAAGQSAIAIYKNIINELNEAYKKGDAEDFQHVATARGLMFALDSAADSLAANRLGVPFF